MDKKDKILTVRTAAGKQHVLLHDVDSGRPCLKCGEECSGFLYHFWRKICVNCRCPREFHDIEVIERAKPSAPAWAHVFKNNEASAAGASAGPNAGPDDDKWAIRLRMKQNPDHDSDATKCRALTDEKMMSEFEKLKVHRETEAFGVGKCTSASTDTSTPSTVASAEAQPMPIPVSSSPAEAASDKQPRRTLSSSKVITNTCHGCTDHFAPGENIVTAELINKSFHLGCFKCKKCSELLIDFIYYAREGDIYCGRCHAELFVPRCAGCDELIFDPTYTEAEDKSWHPDHFCCWACDDDLCEKQYAKNAMGNPFCIPCYNENIAPQCGTCQTTITAGSKAMLTGGLSFHSSQSCFKCNTCDKHLMNEKCMLVGTKLYCIDDYQRNFTVVCVRCKQKVVNDFMQVQDKRFHKECYNCFDCKKLFGKSESEAAYPFEGELYCYEHAMERAEAS